MFELVNDGLEPNIQELTTQKYLQLGNPIFDTCSNNLHYWSPNTINIPNPLASVSELIIYYS